ncbi:MAG: O-antigen ligase family protein [Desulfobacterales bacterium]|nr:O-antigen ligase family protein [Desulfobacterales bacterium]
MSKARKYDPIFMSAIYPINRIGYLALIPIYLCKYSKRFSIYSFLIIVLGLVGIRFFISGSTSVAVAILLLFISLIFKKTKVFMFFIAVGFVIWFFFYLQPHLTTFMTKGKSSAVHESVILQMDGNSTTRFFMWSHLIFDFFPENVFGIGFGTPMIKKQFLYKLNMNKVANKDPWIEYTLGAHNSFITIFIRCGVLGIIAFIFLYWRIIGEFANDRANDNYSKVFFFYYAFFIVTGIAMLNVILESPMYAAGYWIVLGMLYEVKKK